MRESLFAWMRFWAMSRPASSQNVPFRTLLLLANEVLQLREGDRPFVIVSKPDLALPSIFDDFRDGVPRQHITIDPITGEGLHCADPGPDIPMI
jgi:hypothetical protein